MSNSNLYTRIRRELVGSHGSSIAERSRVNRSSVWRESCLTGLVTDGRIDSDRWLGFFFVNHIGIEPNKNYITDGSILRIVVG
jgi:hypothetical protein